MSKKLAYTLGTYLAHHLIDRHIPSLSCNPVTNRVVEVTWGEAQKSKRLHDTWYSRVCEERVRLKKECKDSGIEFNEQEVYDLSKEEWNTDLKYKYILKEKYLPHTLRCLVYDIDFSNDKINKEIKKGLIDALWGWDFCDWSLREEDIILENEVVKYGENKKYEFRNSWVILKLCLDAPSSFTGDEWIEIKTPQKK